MITQVCNLSCQGCTNFSDLKHNGYVSWQQGQGELESWLSRLNILDFGIMGGEPLINPQWQQWVQGVRNLLPHAQIRFTTNGLLIQDPKAMLDLFEQIGNIVFKISVHVTDTKLEQTIADILQAREWQQVREHGIMRWKTKNNLRFQLNRPVRFFKSFRGDYANMRPHHNSPVEAFENCVQQTCPLLYQGRIYKCSTSALTMNILQRHGNPYEHEWHRYLDSGLGADCNDQDLEGFIANFGRPNRICGQCPTKNDTQSQLDHTSTVTFK